MRTETASDAKSSLTSFLDPEWGWTLSLALPALLVCCFLGVQWLKAPSKLQATADPAARVTEVVDLDEGTTTEDVIRALGEPTLRYTALPASEKMVYVFEERGTDQATVLSLRFEGKSLVQHEFSLAN